MCYAIVINNTGKGVIAMDRVFFGPNGITALGKICCIGFFVVGLAAIIFCHSVPWVSPLMLTPDTARYGIGLAIMLVQALIGVALMFVSLEIWSGWSGGMSVD